MIILVAHDLVDRRHKDRVFEIEASSCKEAMDIIAEKIFDTDYDKKYSNLSAVEKPLNEKDCRELIRKLCIGTGEFFEYFGYHNWCSEYIQEYLENLLKQFCFESKYKCSKCGVYKCTECANLTGICKYHNRGCLCLVK
jgi:hypothetical protein